MKVSGHIPVCERCVRVAPPKSGQTLGCRGKRRLPGMTSSWRVRAAPPWIRQRLWWERAAPPVEGKITCRLHFQRRTAAEGCHDPELVLSNPESRMTNEAPLPTLQPPLQPRCNYIHPRQLSPFPERLKLLFSSDEILSGSEQIVSSGTDQFTASVKTDPHDTLVHHMVDVEKAITDFREESERRNDASSQKISLPHKLIQSFTCVEAAKYLQLEPRAPTRKGRCFRKTDCRQVARHHNAGSY